MMRRFKRAFMSRLLRERVLLAALVALAVSIWGSGFLRRLGVALEENRRVSTELSVQAQWLERRALRRWRRPRLGTWSRRSRWMP